MSETSSFEIWKPTLGLVIVLWLYWLWTRRHFYRFAMKFPGCFNSPIVGIFSKIKDHKYVLYLLEKLMHECGGYTICIWIGLYPAILTCDPDFIEQTLTSPDLLNKSEQMYTPMSLFFNGGLLSDKFSVWQPKRRIINHSFAHKVLLSLIPTFNKAKNIIIKEFEPLVDKGANKLSQILMHLSFRISTETLLGAEKDEEGIVGISNKFGYSIKMMSYQIHFSYLNLESIFTNRRKIAPIKDELQSFVHRHIKHRFDKLDAEKTLNCNTNSEKHQLPEQDVIKDVNDNDLIAIQKEPMIFVDKLHEKRQQLTMEDMKAEGSMMLLASYETTATGILCTLVMLAMHQDVQQRLYEEICSVLPDKKTEVSYEHLQQLTYLEQVVNETLRLAPSVPLIGRHVVKDTQISKDVILPKGFQILISIFHLQRRKDIWGPDADKFNPDNFLPENVKRRHPYAFIPFSKGARNCIGWRYALINMKISLIGILLNFKIYTQAKYEDLKYHENLVLKYFEEPALRLERRTEN